MNKTVKKLEKQLIKALTTACETAKSKITGFDWLTHNANHANFPDSLVVRCVFDTQESVVRAKQEKHDEYLVKLIHGELLRAGVLLKSPKRHVIFDSEEACMRDHNGSWKKRLQALH